MRVLNIAHHRNGISGNSFYVVTFKDEESVGVDHEMVAVVFEEQGSVAVLDVNLLHTGDIAFGSNSWRGDVYEKRLRAAIVVYERQRAGNLRAAAPLRPKERPVRHDGNRSHGSTDR